MLNLNLKSNQLIQKMVTAYWNGHFRDKDMAWVPHTDLAKITVAYSQRFGGWLKESNGLIKVEKRSDGDKGYSYRLVTCPDYIDWDTLKPVVPRQRKKRHGKPVETPEVQESFL